MTPEQVTSVATLPAATEGLEAMIRRDPNTQKYVKRRMWRHLVVFGLGALVVAGGIVLCHFF